MPHSSHIIVDFLCPKSLYRLKTSNPRDPLLRAIGLKPQGELKVIDATAGFGFDACLMAYHGAQVLMLERESVMGELLQAGLIRAQTAGELMQVAARMSLKIISAEAYLSSLNKADYPDVIYLDPMFIHKKKSALPNKNMQFLQQICQNESDPKALLTLALFRAKHRVVIKRSLNAPFLADIKPHMSIKTKLLRFDVFMCASMLEMD